MSQPLALHTLPIATPRQRLIVVSLVVALHAGAAACWLMQPSAPAVSVNEMTVSVAMRQAEVAVPQAQPALPPRVQQQVPVRPVRQPLARPVVQETAEVAAPAPQVQPAQLAEAVQTVQPAAPVADSEPDYRAAHLDNPRPPYPMVARRMGWEGRVILNVEVLAEGRCGGINVFRSSGHEVLDNAAVNTVKGWRFQPARHAGHPVTQWFRLPINFSLEGNEA